MCQSRFKSLDPGVYIYPSICPHCPSHEVFSWAAAVLLMLTRFMTWSALENSLLLAAPIASTHFRGLGTVEQAYQCLQAASRRKVLKKPLAILFLAACEKDRQCRTVLKEALPPVSCILTDIMARCPAALPIWRTHATGTPFKVFASSGRRAPLIPRRGPLNKARNALQVLQVPGGVAP